MAMNNKDIIKDFPFEVEELDLKESQAIVKSLPGLDAKFVRIGPKKYFLQKGYLSEAGNIYNFPIKSDDVFVVAYPKSGTTLAQELVWLICNNLDYESAQLKKLTERFPFLEISSLVGEWKVPYSDDQKKLKKAILSRDVKSITEMPSPRFIKSHLPLSLLPQSLLDTAKVVYAARDPRDVAVSYFYHHKLTKLCEPDTKFKTFWSLFVSDNILWGPYFEHVLEAWEKRNHPHMLLLFYEEMTKDMKGTIERVANFFDKKLSDDQINELANHLEFNNFKKNKSVNLEHLQENGFLSSEVAFIRKGKTGGWRDYFDEEMTAQADEWIAKNLRNTDFRFPHC